MGGGMEWANEQEELEAKKRKMIIINKIVESINEDRWLMAEWIYDKVFDKE